MRELVKVSTVLGVTAAISAFAINSYANTAQINTITLTSSSNYQQVIAGWQKKLPKNSVVMVGLIVKSANPDIAGSSSVAGDYKFALDLLNVNKLNQVQAKDLSIINYSVKSKGYAVDYILKVTDSANPNTILAMCSVEKDNLNALATHAFNFTISSSGQCSVNTVS